LKHWLIGLIGLSALSASATLLACWLIGLVSLVGLMEKLYVYAASLFHVHSFVRETLWWFLAIARKKMCWWIASFGYSYHSDILHFSKQLFTVMLQLMTKYFIMRECENILSGYLCVVTTVFSQQVLLFNFPNSFWRSLTEISLFLQVFSWF
jgi:hypothetical protein